MWYVGTKNNCEAYELDVRSALNISGKTQRWSDVIRHDKKSLFAVAASELVDNESLRLVDTLTDDWFPDEQL